MSFCPFRWPPALGPRWRMTFHAAGEALSRPPPRPINLQLALDVTASNHLRPRCGSRVAVLNPSDIRETVGRSRRGDSTCEKLSRRIMRVGTWTAVQRDVVEEGVLGLAPNHQQRRCRDEILTSMNLSSATHSLVIHHHYQHTLGPRRSIVNSQSVTK